MNDKTKINMNDTCNIFTDGYEFKKPDNPPQIKDDEVHKARHIDIKLYADFGDGNGYTIHDGTVLKSHFEENADRNISYKYYIGSRQLGIYFENQKTMWYGRSGNIPNGFYWDYHKRSDIDNENGRLKEEIEDAKAIAMDWRLEQDKVTDSLRKQIHGFKTKLAEVSDKRVDLQKELDELKTEYHEALSELEKVTSLLMGSKRWRENIHDSISHLLELLKVSNNGLKFSRKQVNAIAQTLIDETYPADLDGGLGKLKQTIRKIINQNKADYWHVGVPKDDLIDHRLKSALNYNSELLQQKEALNEALVLMNKEVNEQKEINNELEKKLHANS